MQATVCSGTAVLQFCLFPSGYCYHSYFKSVYTYTTTVYFKIKIVVTPAARYYLMHQQEAHVLLCHTFA